MPETPATTTTTKRLPRPPLTKPRPRRRPAMRRPEPPEVEPLLRLRDVAQRLQVTRHTVRKLIQRRGLRFARIGRELRFKPEWVEEFIETIGMPSAAQRHPPAKRRA
jgi:excisionase family DNA binding protein